MLSYLEPAGFYLLHICDYRLAWCVSLIEQHVHSQCSTSVHYTTDNVIDKLSSQDYIDMILFTCQSGSCVDKTPR